MSTSFSMIARRVSSNSFGNGASLEEIAAAAERLHVAFPVSYAEFLAQLGWLEGGELTVYGLGAKTPKHLNLVRMAAQERKAWDKIVPMPDGLVPISPDGRGGHYCLDTRRSVEGECPVVYWDHELVREGYKPELSGRSFAKFFERHAPKRKRSEPKVVDMEKAINAIARQAKRSGFIEQHRWSKGASRTDIAAAEKALGLEFSAPLRLLLSTVDGFDHAAGYDHFGVRRGIPDSLSALRFARRLRAKSPKNKPFVPISHIWVGPLCCFDCSAAEPTVVLFDEKRLTRMRNVPPLPFSTWAMRMGRGSLDPWDES